MHTKLQQSFALWHAWVGSAQPQSMFTHWSEQHGSVLEQATPSSLHVGAAGTHVPVVALHSSAPQQSLLSPHVLPMFAHPHLPLVHTSEQHPSGSVQAVPSAAQTLSVQTEPTHSRLPQQSELTVHGCVADAHPQVLVPGSHCNAPQQSDVAVQSSPAPPQAHTPDGSHTSPPQQSPSARHALPATAHVHVP